MAIMKRGFCLLATLVLLLSVRGLSQTLPAGPQVLTFHSDVDDTEQPYGLYLPPKFDTSKKYPLVIMLHGAGSNHRLALRRVFGKSNLPQENDVEASRYFPEWRHVDFIVATPYARGTMGYQSVAEKDVYDVLDDVQRRFPIDEDRIYLTGLSMGGGGTLWLGLSRPDVWAALAPVCPAPPDGTEDFAPNALNMPLHFFHGGADPVVSPPSVRDWVQRLKDAGAQVEYTEFPGVGHNSWENAYQDGSVFTWFNQFRRHRFPERVRFASSQYEYDSAYWVHFDELTPGTVASIDAKFTAPNRIAITTSALGAFTLRLQGHPRCNASRPVEVMIDGKKLTSRTSDGALAFSKREGKWATTKYAAATHAKRPGAEGPMSAVIAGRHIYVYGTADNPAPQELQARREQADSAANWSVDRGPFLRRVMVFPRVVADKDVRASDFESSNLILFGTKETNSVIAQYAEQLPMHFKPETGYGLVYVFPAAAHYVLINSGLPWWAKEEGGDANASTPAPRRRGYRPLYGPPGLLMDLEDYALFKGSLDNVVANGRFDNNWRVPEADMEKLQATGVIALEEQEAQAVKLQK